MLLIPRNIIINTSGIVCPILEGRRKAKTTPFRDGGRREKYRRRLENRETRRGRREKIIDEKFRRRRLKPSHPRQGPIRVPRSKVRVYCSESCAKSQTLLYIYIRVQTPFLSGSQRPIFWQSAPETLIIVRRM